MNQNKILYKKSVLIVMMFCLIGVHVFGQDAEKPKKKNKTYMYLDYYKKTDGTKQLVATLKSKVDRSFVLLSDMPVYFEMDTDTGSVDLGEVNTNIEGVAVFNLNNDNLFYDEEGYLRVAAEFKGDKEFKKKSSKTKAKDVSLSVELAKKGDKKTIQIKADEFSQEGAVPVDDLDIKVYVKRMFSLLEVGEGSTKNGKLKMKFPDDIPGDSIGNLQVYTLVENDRSFGNVENIQTAEWGVAVTERESFKSKFSGGSYIFFMIISVLISLSIILIFSKKKVNV